jgi:UDP-glucose 4-epimerase
MRYLITGGAGFIGSHLSDFLIKRGDFVTIFDNFSTGNLKNIEHQMGSKQFTVIDGSILNLKALNAAVASVDHVLHLAAAVGVFTIVNNPLESLTTNLKGTENVLELSNLHGKEVLIASTSEIYGKNDASSLSEDSDRIIGSPLKSRWSYSEAKAVDESMAFFYFAEKELKTRIVRFFNTIGPRQIGNYGMVVPRFIEAALKGEFLDVYGSGEQLRCFCNIQDAIEALISVIDSNNTIGDVYNIGNDSEISIKNLAALVVNKLESKSQIRFVPYEQAYKNGFEDMQKRVPNISKIKQVTGWEPKYSLEQTIVDIASHMKR